MYIRVNFSSKFPIFKNLKTLTSIERDFGENVGIDVLGFEGQWEAVKVQDLTTYCARLLVFLKVAWNYVSSVNGLQQFLLPIEIMPFPQKKLYRDKKRQEKKLDQEKARKDNITPHYPRDSPDAPP